MSYAIYGDLFVNIKQLDCNRIFFFFGGRGSVGTFGGQVSLLALTFGMSSGIYSVGSFTKHGL